MTYAAPLCTMGWVKIDRYKKTDRVFCITASAVKVSSFLQLWERDRLRVALLLIRVWLVGLHAAAAAAVPGLPALPWHAYAW